MRNNHIYLLMILAVALAGCQTTTGRTGSNSDSAADTYVELGLNYLREGSRDQARFNLLKAIELAPRSAQANNAMALLYQTEGESEQADSHFRKAISADASFTQARNNYARFLLLQGRADEAEDQYQRVVDDINYRLRAQAFLGLGLARKEQQDFAGAKDAFTRAYQRDSRVTLALLELADTAVREADYVLAKEFLDQFESQSAPTPRSSKLGLDLALKFSDQDAIASYSMALRNMFPDSREGREYILSTQGDN